jgi:hypothetical protein
MLLRNLFLLLLLHCWQVAKTPTALAVPRQRYRATFTEADFRLPTIMASSARWQIFAAR